MLGELVGFIMTFGVGGAGFLLFKKLGIPNPALLGAIFSTGLLNITGHYPYFSTGYVAFAANAVIGVMLGRQIDRNILRRMKELFFYVFSVGTGMIFLSLVSGYALYWMTGLPLETALIASSAGGITEMVAFGLSVDADVATVAFVQLFRVVTFLAIISYFPALAGKKQNHYSERRKILVLPSQQQFALRHYFVLAAAASGGAVLANAIHIPAGPMLGALAASGCCVLLLGRVYAFDTRLRYAAQICLGLVMGQKMTPDVAAQLGKLFLPAAATTLVMLLGSVALAFALYKTSRWDLTTCLLCTSPAGLSQITVFAEEIGVDSFTAAVFHTVRILGIVSIYPWIVLAVM